VTERAISQDRNSPDHRRSEHRRSDHGGPDRSEQELDRLAELAEDVIRRARAAGASQAEVAASIDTGLSVNVRLGEVETVEHTRDRGFGLTVYFGQRKGSASTADLHPDSILRDRALHRGRSSGGFGRCGAHGDVVS
jgi:hypothetical protein